MHYIMKQMYGIQTTERQDYVQNVKMHLYRYKEDKTTHRSTKDIKLFISLFPFYRCYI